MTEHKHYSEQDRKVNKSLSFTYNVNYVNIYLNKVNKITFIICLYGVLNASFISRR